MSDFTVDTASLGRFRAAAERAQGRVGELRGLADAARLVPGTFTRTEGGQLADSGHAEMLAGLNRLLEAAGKGLGGIAEATAATLDNYESTDAHHGAAMSDLQGGLDSARGYEA
ncbi:MAG: hypothetical protein GEV03_09335 [Streptosporangiales bacterium]|nr:hypothetical protein [Streptosporangiales bacterium]